MKLLKERGGFSDGDLDVVLGNDLTSKGDVTSVTLGDISALSFVPDSVGADEEKEGVFEGQVNQLVTISQVASWNSEYRNLAAVVQEPFAVFVVLAPKGKSMLERLRGCGARIAGYVVRATPAVYSPSLSPSQFLILEDGDGEHTAHQLSCIHDLQSKSTTQIMIFSVSCTNCFKNVITFYFH